MPQITQEDLQFRMKVIPDTDAMGVAIKNIGKQVNSEANKIKDGWAALAAEGSRQFQSLNDHANLISGMTAAANQAIPTAQKYAPVDPMMAKLSAFGNGSNIDMIAALSKAAKPENDRLESMKAVTQELESQEKLLLLIKSQMDPENLRKRVALEKQITEAKKDYEKAEKAEQRKQGTLGGFNISKLFDTFKNDGLKAAVKGMFTKDSGFDVGSLISKVKGPPKSPPGVGAAGAASEGAAASGGMEGGAALLGAAALPVAVVAAVVVGAVVAVKNGLDLLAGGLKNLQGELGPIGIFFDAIPIFGGALKDITTSLVGMAGMASPALFKQWKFALDDVQGVIGRSFLPVLDLMSEAVRFFGDVLASILPTTQEMATILVPVKAGWEDLKKSLKDFFSDSSVKQGILSAFNMLATAAGGLATALGVLAKSMHIAYAVASRDWPMLARALARNPNQELASSVGAAARPAHISSLEDYQKQLQIAAYSQPAGLTAAQTTASNTGAIANTVDRILETVQGAARVAPGATGAAGSVVGDVARGLWDNIGRDALRGLPGFGG